MPLAQRPISPTGQANDRMRLRALCGIPQHHRITITQGIQAYPPEQQEEIMKGFGLPGLH